MAGDAASNRMSRLGASVFHAVLLLLGAGARLLKGVALFIAGGADEVSEWCLTFVASKAEREGRIIGEPSGKEESDSREVKQSRATEGCTWPLCRRKCLPGADGAIAETSLPF